MSGEAGQWAVTLIVLAVASSLGVSVIYLPQAMLTEMADGLGVSPGAAGIVANVVQVGYAVGIFLLVPLADRVHPRRQTSVQSCALAIALLVAAVMPTLIALAVSFLVVGLVANIAQVLIPTVSRLAPKGRAATATGIMVGALLMGVFGGRIIASALVDLVGWRVVVLIFAGLLLTTVPLTRRVLDVEWHAAAPTAKYRSLLASTIGLARRSPELAESAIIQFLVFATFNSFWTVVVLHLTADPYNWSVLQAGMFGFVGLAAAVITPVLGPVIERFGPLVLIGVSIVVLFGACVAAVFDAYVVALFAVTLFVVTAANQAVQAANQSRVLAANPDSAAQANTLFMVGVFLGGSAGAVIGPLAYALGRMPVVAMASCVLVCLAAVAWVLVRSRQRRRDRAATVGCQLLEPSVSAE